MPLLPVNADSREVALRIAADALQRLTPKGATATLDALVAEERPARPFDKVALQQAGVLPSKMVTYVYSVTVTKGEVTKE